MTSARGSGFRHVSGALGSGEHFLRQTDVRVQATSSSQPGSSKAQATSACWVLRRRRAQPQVPLRSTVTTFQEQPPIICAGHGSPSAATSGRCIRPTCASPSCWTTSARTCRPRRTVRVGEWAEAKKWSWPTCPPSRPGSTASSVTSPRCATSLSMHRPRQPRRAELNDPPLHRMAKPPRRRQGTSCNFNPRKGCLMRSTTHTAALLADCARIAPVGAGRWRTPVPRPDRARAITAPTPRTNEALPGCAAVDVYGLMEPGWASRVKPLSLGSGLQE